MTWVDRPKPDSLRTGVVYRTFQSRALLSARVDHIYLEVEGLNRERDILVTMYRTSWFDDHAESFRRAAK